MDDWLIVVVVVSPFTVIFLLMTVYFYRYIAIELVVLLCMLLIFDV